MSHKMATPSSKIDAETGINVKPYLNNKIDKEVQRMFLPLNFMQCVMLNPKYYIKNNLIYQNSFINKFISISGAVFFVTLYIHRLLEVMLDDNFLRYSPVDFIIFASNFEVIFKCLGFIMNSTMQFVCSKKNVLFVLHFQEVHRILSDATNVKHFILRSWMSVVSIFMFFGMIVTYERVFFYEPPWNAVVFKLIFMVQDSNLIYLIRLINLLTDKVKLWNIQLLLLQKNGCNKLQAVKMFQAYDQILKCYNIVKIIYQVPVIYHTTGVLWQSLIDIQIVIQFSKIEYKTVTRENPFLSILIFFCLTKNYVIHTSLGLQLQAFYKVIQDTQDSYKFMLASDCTDEQKKLCKNIQRLHRVSFSKMSACGLFYIDVCHPLRLLSLLSHYTIVQLQFAFL